MVPVLRFVVGGWHVAVSTHALCVILAAIAGTLVVMRRLRDARFALAWAPVLVVAVLAGASGLFRVTHGGQGGGLSSMGGAVALGVVTALSARPARQRFTDLVDAAALAGLVALGVGRLGCFLGGCCYGRPTDLPWGVVLPELGPLARHPLQLYAAGLDLVLAGLLARTGGPPGALAARAAVGFGAGRLVLERLRDPAAADPPLAGLGTAPAGAVLALVAGTVAIVRLRRR